MSVGMSIKFSDGGSLATLNLKILKLSNPNLRDLMEDIGSEVEAQTRTRIQDEKKAPDGSKWKDWSKKYVEKQHGRTSAHRPHSDERRKSGGHSMLQLDGGLMDSLQYESDRDETVVGSNLVYARSMNDQRQYLGLSAQNVDDLEQLVVDFFENRLR